MNQQGKGPLILTESAEAPIQSLKLYGWSKQDGTPSPENPVPIMSAGSVLVENKNLLNIPDREPEVHEGITFSVSGGVVTMSGTLAEDEVSASSGPICDIPIVAGTYFISGFDGSIYASVEVMNADGSQLSYVNRSFTLDGTETSCKLWVVCGTSLEAPYQLKPMLNVGDTYLPWEPYHAPYIDPDEGEINVTVQGGNLADVLNPDNWVYNAENGPYLSYKIPVPSGTYTISMSQNNMNKNYFTEHGINDAIALYFGGTPGVASPNKLIGNSGSTNTATTTTTSVLGSVYLNLYYYSGSGQQITSFTREDLEYIFSYVPDFMLNAGSTALPYMPYKQPQTLTAQTPGGLAGIPVSSGGNYTDESGQAWICDEVDFRRGKYVQRVWKGTFDGSEAWNIYTFNLYEGFLLTNVLPEIANNISVLCNQAVKFTFNSSKADTIRIGANNQSIIMCNNSFYDDSLPDKGLANWKAHLAAHPLGVMTYLETPIETDLSDEEMAQFLKLHSEYPNTTVMNDADAWMYVQYLKNEDLHEGPFSDPYSEIGKYYKALARYTLEYPEATCRETQLIRAIMDPNYICPFTVTYDSSLIEKYLWDILQETTEMISNVPQSDAEKFLHMMIGGSVEDYPDLDCERNFWMSRCVERVAGVIAQMSQPVTIPLMANDISNTVIDSPLKALRSLTLVESEDETK